MKENVIIVQFVFIIKLQHCALWTDVPIKNELVTDKLKHDKVL